MAKVKLELSFPGTLKDEPIICNLCKQFDIVLSILEASFSTTTGWAILIFEGEEAELEKAFGYLREKGVTFEGVQS
jgi:ABC-type methionine transport system ATPase subunit